MKVSIIKNNKNIYPIKSKCILITQKDWEEVTYYIVLIIFMVMGMDTFSGWLRRRLIKGKDDR